MGSDSSKNCPDIDFEEASELNKKISLAIVIVSVAYIGIFLPWYLYRSLVDDFIRRRDIFLVCVQTLGALFSIGFLVQEISGRTTFPCIVTRNLITLTVLFLYVPQYLRNIKFYFRIKLNKKISDEIFANTAMESSFMQENIRAERESFSAEDGFGQLSKSLSQPITKSGSFNSNLPRKSFNFGRTLNLSIFTKDIDASNITFADAASENESYTSNEKRSFSERSSAADLHSGHTKERKDAMQLALYLASDKFLSRFYVVFFIATLIIAIPLSWDIVTCTGCDVVFTDLTIFFAFSITSGPFLAYIVWQIRKEPDPLNLKFELAYVILIIGGPFMMAWILLYYLDPGQLMRDGTISWHYIYVICTMMVWSVIVPLAIWNGYKISAKNKKIDDHPELMTVLDSKIGMRMFQTHLANELSIENIMFWSEATSWKQDFNKVSQRKRELKMKQIERVFIDETSTLQVNLPSEVRKTLETTIDSGLAITEDIFDDAINEIYKLMERDSFPRFLQSDLYEKYQSNDFSALM